MEKRIDRFKRAAAAVAGALDAVGFVWLWVAISLLLLVLVTVLNPLKLGSYLWFMSKLAGAAALGFGFDSAFFRGSDPRYLEGIERSLAQTRRATLIAASLIGAGLIG